MKVLNKFAFVRLDKNNNLLFSEYIRIQKENLTKDKAVRIIKSVLHENLNKNETAKKILERLISGGIYVPMLSKSRSSKSR